LRSLLQLGVILLTTGTAIAAGPAATRTTYDLTLKNGFTIHHLRHEVVGSNTRIFVDENSYIDVATSDIAEITETRDTIPQSASPAPKTVDLSQVVSAASDKHLIDADLISSVIHAESSFNPKAVSKKGAQGLMQLMPQTASKLGVADAFDPYANIDAGTHYLRELLLRYNGDMQKALAAYNAGPLRVEQYHGVPPYRETRAYVAQVIKEFNRKKLAARTAAKKEITADAEHSSSGKSR